MKKKLEIKAIIYSVLFLAVAFALPLLCNISNSTNFKCNKLYTKALNIPSAEYIGSMIS